jgi:transcriptional regulator with XRE-family HTH domain
MKTHLATYFCDQRTEKGVTLGQLARMVGYKNVSKGANKISRFEQQGTVTEELLVRLAEALDIDLPTVEALMEKDQEDHLQRWQEWVNEPVPMCLVVRYIPGVYGRQALPEDVKTQEEAESYACQFARQSGKKVCLALSRRHSVWIDETGKIYDRTEATPNHPNAPYMSLKSGRKFLFQFDLHEHGPEWPAR